MTTWVRSAQRAVIGPGAAGQAGEHAAQFGKRALVLGGTRAIEAVRPVLLPSLDTHGIAYHVEQGERVRKTRQGVDLLVATGREQRVELVIGCGGGAIMDCAKHVSHELGVPLINVPTTASTNACGTLGAGIEGDTVARRSWYQGADVVIADTTIIAAAGGRFLASGIGDALPTWYGAQVALRRGGAEVSATRVAMAKLCTELLLQYGARAYRACVRGHSTPEVDRVVEAIVYCSGVAGFGMSGDHVLHPAGITRCTRAAIHGEWVAFGLLVRMVLGGDFASELPALVRFLQSVNLPTRFVDFGLDSPTPEELLVEARRIVGPSGQADYGTGRSIAPEAVCEAMLEVDCLGRSFSGSPDPA